MKLHKNWTPGNYRVKFSRTIWYQTKLTLVLRKWALERSAQGDGVEFGGPLEINQMVAIPFRRDTLFRLQIGRGQELGIPQAN